MTEHRDVAEIIACHETAPPFDWHIGPSSPEQLRHTLLTARTTFIECEDQ